MNWRTGDIRTSIYTTFEFSLAVVYIQLCCVDVLRPFDTFQVISGAFS